MLKRMSLVKGEKIVFLQRMLECTIIYVNLCKFRRAFVVEKVVIHMNIA